MTRQTRSFGDALTANASPQASSLRLGIDVGGTKIEGVALDETGSVVASCRSDTHPGNQAVLASIVATTRQLLTQAGDPGASRTLSLGLGIPGLVDSRAGTVKDAVNLGVSHMPLAQEVQAALAIPVQVENDVNAAALGASQGLDLPCVAFINLGTGLAAGVIRGGQIDHGSTGSVGEIGHIPADCHGFACKCGQRGCLETVASGSAIKTLWPQADPPLPDLLSQAQAGKTQAQAVLDIIRSGIATAVELVALTLDPDAIILGGGVTKAGPALLNKIRAELENRAQRSPFIASLKLPERLSLVPPEGRIGAIGAALAGFARARTEAAT